MGRPLKEPTTGHSVSQDHAANHVAIIQRLSQNTNLSPQALAGMLNGLGKAQLVFANAKAKSKEARLKAGPPQGWGQSQGGGGNQK